MFDVDPGNQALIDANNFATSELNTAQVDYDAALRDLTTKTMAKSNA
jgi:hypothetical protein